MEKENKKQNIADYLDAEFLLENYADSIKNSDLSYECKNDLISFIEYEIESDRKNAYKALENFCAQVLIFVLFPEYQTVRRYYEIISEYYVEMISSKDYLSIYNIDDIKDVYKRSKEKCRIQVPDQYDYKLLDLPNDPPEWFKYKLLISDDGWKKLCLSVCKNKELLREFGDVEKYEDIIRDYC